MHYCLYPALPGAELSVESSTQPGAVWKFVSDQIMGGRSQGRVVYQQEGGAWLSCLQGEVSLENRGGFIQMQFDVSAVPNLADFDGFYMTWRGVAPAVAAHLKTTELSLPWQSYKKTVFAWDDWHTDYWRFEQFVPYRTSMALKVKQITRFGLLAIGQAGLVNICVREFGLAKF